MNWIKVEDKLPEQNHMVLTYGHPNDGGYYIRMCEHSDGIFRFLESGKEHKGTISHWSQLPEPPKD